MANDRYFRVGSRTIPHARVSEVHHHAEGGATIFLRRDKDDWVPWQIVIPAEEWTALKDAFGGEPA